MARKSGGVGRSTRGTGSSRPRSISIVRSSISAVSAAVKSAQRSPGSSRASSWARAIDGATLVVGPPSSTVIEIVLRTSAFWPGLSRKRRRNPSSRSSCAGEILIARAIPFRGEGRERREHRLDLRRARGRATRRVGSGRGLRSVAAPRRRGVGAELCPPRPWARSSSQHGDFSVNETPQIGGCGVSSARARAGCRRLRSAGSPCPRAARDGSSSEPARSVAAPRLLVGRREEEQVALEPLARARRARAASSDGSR